MNPFTAHPRSLNETYLCHMKNAWYISFSMLAAGLACAVHSVFPFLFADSANRTVQRLHQFYQTRSRP